MTDEELAEVERVLHWKELRAAVESSPEIAKHCIGGGAPMRQAVAKAAVEALPYKEILALLAEVKRLRKYSSSYHGGGPCIENDVHDAVWAIVNRWHPELPDIAVAQIANAAASAVSRDQALPRPNVDWRDGDE